jgi:glutamate-5-semialdehyde dehydrogenase
MSAVSDDLTTAARSSARVLAAAPAAARNAALAELAAAIELRAAEILDANARDVEGAQDQRAAIVDRLTLTGDRVRGMAAAVRAVAALPDPIGTVVADHRREDGLHIQKLRVPLGVVAVVYEARPNVTTDAVALTLKSANACILRGSQLAASSNAVLTEIARTAVEASGLPADSVSELGGDRDALRAFVARPNATDVVIPRGGEELKRFLLEHSRVPVLAAGGGNCHIYVDAAADAGMAEAIAINAKTHRPGVCNAAETLLVHRDRADLLDAIGAALERAGVELVEGEEGWSTEFLDMKMGVRLVDSLDQALDHIAHYGTGHSEAIVTADPEAARRFVTEVDAAAVYVNASTRFTDGAEFGKGAEIGISTNRLHARGPVGLEELTTTKYIVHGDGHIRT